MENSLFQQKEEKMKKQLATVLALLLTVSTMVGCGGKSGGDEKTGGDEPKKTEQKQDEGKKDDEDKGGEQTGGKPHYNIMVAFRPQHEDFAKMPVVQSILDDAGIEVTWEQVGDAALTEKKNIAISTGSMPDAIFGMVNTNDVLQNPELFLPLNEYVETLPNISKLMEEKPDAKTFLTFPNGNIYSFPFVQEREYEGFPDQLYINKAWLDTLGLEMPKTYKEYEEVLKAFKEGDPNGNGEADEIPFTMMINHSYFGPYSMYGMFGRLDNTNRLVVEDGKIVFTADKEEWKNATKWFAGLYAQDLIDPESFTQDRSMLFAKGKADPMLIGSTNAFLLDNVVGANRMENYQWVLLEGEGGQKAIRYDSFPVQSRTTAVVNANIENPDGLMKFFDVCLDESKHYPLQTVFGLIGKQLVETDVEGKEFEFAIAPEGLSQDDYRYKDAPSNFPTYLTKESWDSVVHAPDVARKEAILEEVRPYLEKESMPPILFNEEETQQLADISSALMDYVSQQQALWITNQSDIDADWDNYVQTLNQMGLEQYINIYQAGYNRYYG